VPNFIQIANASWVNLNCITGVYKGYRFLHIITTEQDSDWQVDSAYEEGVLAVIAAHMVNLNA
jgi:hypothetical protein